MDPATIINGENKETPAASNIENSSNKPTTNAFSDKNDLKIDVIPIPNTNLDVGTSSAHLPSADLPSAALPAADLPPADLPAVNLPAADLQPADLPAANLPAADLPPADLPAANLPAADLPAADLPSAHLPAADLPPADIPSADLPSTNIEDQISDLNITQDTTDDINKHPIEYMPFLDITDIDLATITAAPDENSNTVTTVHLNGSITSEDLNGINEDDILNDANSVLSDSENVGGIKIADEIDMEDIDNVKNPEKPEESSSIKIQMTQESTVVVAAAKMPANSLLSVILVGKTKPSLEMTIEEV